MPGAFMCMWLWLCVVIIVWSCLLLVSLCRGSTTVSHSMSIIHDNDSLTLYLLIVVRNLATFTVKPTMQFIHSSLVAATSYSSHSITLLYEPILMY